MTLNNISATARGVLSAQSEAPRPERRGFPERKLSILDQGSGCFFHGKIPGCCLPNLTAATALHFTAGYLKLSLQQEPTPCFAFLGGLS
jgi:hypothetical protein